MAKAPREVDFREILATLDRAYPDPKCELRYSTPYQLLVSVILSAQTTDKSVNRVMEPLYKQGLGPADVLALGETGLLQKIRSIGLAPSKARNVVRMTKMLHEQHQDKIPRTMDELTALPGVGRKTANVVLGELYGDPTLAVDTHVFRVSARLGLHQERTPEKCEARLLQIVPRSALPRFHHQLIMLGRYVCKARSPQCHQCPLTSICPRMPPQVAPDPRPRSTKATRRSPSAQSHRRAVR